LLKKVGKKGGRIGTILRKILFQERMRVL